MKKTLIILILNFVVFLIPLYAGELIVIRENKVAEHIATRKIGSREYISLNRLADIIFVKQKYKILDGVISFNSIFFKTAGSSFFVVYETKEVFRVAQMQMPTLIINNTHYLPIPDVLRCLLEMDVLSAKIEGNKLIFKKYSGDIYDTFDFDTFDDPMDVVIIEKPKTPKLQPEFIVNYEAIKILNENIIQIEPDLQLMQMIKMNYRHSQQKVTPNVYQIPDEIKSLRKK